MADTSDVVFGAGREVARVPLDPESEEYRLQRTRMGRRKMATFLVRQAGGLEVVEADGTAVAEDWRRLCDALGVNPPPSATPGVCRRAGCDKPLSMTGTVRPTSGSGNVNSERGVARRQGFCSNRCMRISHLRGEGGGDG
jgi:hypothetical protein